MFLKIVASSEPTEVNAISITLTSVLDPSSTWVAGSGMGDGVTVPSSLYHIELLFSFYQLEIGY